mmetsp:Transcript_2010/g.2227  ORF Transcript_2010/g.2227 Transcript_2010/m.2227 type:complete len:112 (+) Transcript_2010:92-427(+)|eukprot:CAMPEP_0168519124 /NCGR_PEP_ID=MMETSP0405-20121227/7133_1 /TAXON_ID=498012 /ORGANISM="Trichosphaerium sp, Strain Am-I-7 wt" /LENGTH=111 /DNA_ID=CAMNT_0008539611 /DNA_START=77 /DNA_END=412 /DNA_ORIENTATION=-
MADQDTNKDDSNLSEVFPTRPFCNEILSRRKLKKSQTRDGSKPVINKKIRIKVYNRKQFLKQIEEKDSVKLNNVETKDRSSPTIEEDVKIGKSPQKNLFAEIESKKASSTE